jgi:hypothetical protein
MSFCFFFAVPKRNRAPANRQVLDLHDRRVLAAPAGGQREGSSTT